MGWSFCRRRVVMAEYCPSGGVLCLLLLFPPKFKSPQCIEIAPPKICRWLPVHPPPPSHPFGFFRQGRVLPRIAPLTVWMSLSSRSDVPPSFSPSPFRFSPPPSDRDGDISRKTFSLKAVSHCLFILSHNFLRDTWPNTSDVSTHFFHNS